MYTIKLNLDVDGIGDPSSVASASVTQTEAVAIKSDDPTWQHCFCPDIKKKHSIQCKYCDKVITGGITRVKYRLAKYKGFNVKPCTKVPPPVMEEMVALLTKKIDEKEEKENEKQRERDEIDLDSSDSEKSGEESGHGNKVIVLKSTKGNGSSSRPPTSGGTIDNFYKPESIEESVQKNKKGLSISQKIQTKLSTQKREERRDKACEYICQFFYEAGIAHNTVTLPSFAHMIEAIGAFGRGLRPPTGYEMSGPFLKKARQKVCDKIKNHQESWKLTDCSVMTDAWTDRKGRGVMNLVVHSAHGVCFLNAFIHKVKEK